MDSIPPELLAVTPAGIPPPGHVPNLVNPPSTGYIFHVVGSIMLAFMLLFATLRFYTKFVIWRRTTADDWTTLIAVIATLAYFGICIFGIETGKYGTHLYDVSLADMMSNNSLISGWLVNWTSAPIWAFAKTSFFIMYLQMFKPFHWVRYTVYVGLFLNWGFYISILIATMYFTTPAPGETWQEGFASARQPKSVEMAVPIATGSLLLDIYIFVIPLLAVSQLQLSAKKKIGVVLVFGTGLIACVASALSIYFKVHLDRHKDDFMYYVLPPMLMAFVEMCVGIACSCMPSCAHFLNSDGNGSSWSVFRSSLLRPFASLRSKVSGASAISRESGPTKRQPHSKRFKHDLDSGSTHELCDAKVDGTIMTVIEAPSSTTDLERGTGRTGIYVNHAFEQNTSGRT